MILLLAAAFAAGPPVQPALEPAQPTIPVMSSDDARSAVPMPPRGLDLRAVAIDAPEVEMALLDSKLGPMLRIGALGGRHGAAPKLAHIAVGWRF